MVSLPQALNAYSNAVGRISGATAVTDSPSSGSGVSFSDFLQNAAQDSLGKARQAVKPYKEKPIYRMWSPLLRTPRQL
jgi:hypothetical protein